ncbi:hypothetical protein BJV82DRAFT_664127 [Fennellomyces sp. T-0311]|nr:hypothetical protein BJV82DRAFT_664127 [Fennellomyces sp. T-0311]
MSKRKAETAIDDNPKQRLRSNDGCALATDSWNAQITIESLKRAHDSAVQCFESVNGRPHCRVAINSTTSLLTDLTSARVALLDMRAAAFGMAAEFDRGICDAEEVILLTPTQPTGYLRAGELYSMRGHQRQAIKIYERGLAIVDPEKQQELRRRLDEANAQQRYCIDIIADLPLDLLPNIMDHLDIKERLTTLMVSKSWRTRLSGYPSIWSNVCIDARDRFEQFKFLDMAQISHHITNLQLCYLGSDHCEQMLLQMIAGSFNRLRTLHIRSCKYETTNLYIALSRVASTLKELEITCYTGKYPLIPFGTILLACRSLEKFHYSHKVVYDSASIGKLAKFHNLSLVDLKLDLMSLDGSDLEAILRHCPKLRRLTIFGCQSHALNIIRRNCPDLEFLSFNYDVEEDMVSKTKLSNGIYHFAVNVRNLDDVAPILMDHRETLEKLDMTLDFPAGDGDPFASLESLDNVRSLVITDTNAPDAFASLLRKLPALEILYVVGCNLCSPAMTTAMGQLCNLDNITLLECDATVSDMCALFRNFSRRGKLYKIDLNHNDFCDDTVLQGLLEIRSLQHIDIGWSDQITNEGIDRFCKGLQQLPYMEKVFFNGLHFTDTTLQHLSGIPSLKYLNLYAVHGTTPAGFKVFAKDKVQVVVGG